MLGLRLTGDEEPLLLLYVRAVMAQALEPRLGPASTGSSEDQRMLYDRLAGLAEQRLTLEGVASLLDARIVLQIDARSPARWAVAYEFDHDGDTYHLGITGHSVATNAGAHGAFDLDHPVWPNARAAVSKLEDGLGGSRHLTLADLLPQSAGAAVTWDIGPSVNDVQWPLALQLSRQLGLADDNSRPPSFPWVLRHLLGQGIVTTENLRRPPRGTYALEEARSGPSVEDAGDLPLQLSRQKNGPADERARYAELQRRFHEMTGRELDLAASLTTPQSDRTSSLEVELQVGSPAGWVPIEHAGAGTWGALVALAAATSGPDQVVFLDEPATHLHSSWQRSLLRYLREQGQIVVVTHSPFLVPAVTSADFSRVRRLSRTENGAEAVGVAQEAVPEAWRERWRQIFAGSTDAKDVLFARGVLLVEGPTEVGALRYWFNDRAVVADPGQESDASSAEARNLAIVSVDGDGNFGAWVSYLEQMRIPWAILADGPALSPAHKRSLAMTLGEDPESGQRTVELLGEQPLVEDFEAWKAYWAGNGVLTVATTFGLKANGEPYSGGSEQSGEIEQFFERLDPELWSQVLATVRSKVRRGYRFAEGLDVASRPEACSALRGLWTSVLSRVDGARHPADPRR
ncbi:MAG: AAA family ATPase [Actinomycetota bacterium]|nr:AAA family ATPase [Actinomycetota bacterium]